MRPSLPPLGLPARPGLRRHAAAPRAALALLLLLTPATVRAQQPAAPPPAACDYRACAYNIVAALHGLRVVAGEAERPVATLGFLWTRDISPAFDGEGSAAARAAVRTRRWGAALTDLGLGLLVAGAATAVTRDLDATATGLLLGGAASVAISVPIQFRADTHLARAVWQHNARYAGGTR